PRRAVRAAQGGPQARREHRAGVAALGGRPGHRGDPEVRGPAAPDRQRHPRPGRPRRRRPGAAGEPGPRGGRRLGLAGARGVVSPARFRPGPEHREIVVLSGSGLSARTGTGTFRGPDGLWALAPETERAMHAELLPDSLPQLWSVWGRMARIARRHGPTPGHRAIARLGAA